MYLAYLIVSIADQNSARQETAIQTWKQQNEIADDELKILEEKYQEKIFKIGSSCRNSFLLFVNEIWLCSVA